MSTFREVTEYRLGVQDLYLHDWAEGTELYKRAGKTNDPQEMADHDGPVLFEDGERTGVYRIFDEDGIYRRQHDYAGRAGYLDTVETEYTAILLEEVERG